MTLIDTIKAAHLAARKARDSNKLTLLTTLIGEAETVGKKEQRAPNDAEVSKLLKKFVDNAKEMARMYGDRHDAENADACWEEVTLYESFLPKQLTDEELQFSVDTAIATFPSKPNIGQVMGVIKSKLEAGTYDGGKLSALIKAALA
jgi:uncharacterized protein YqeY